MKANCWHGKQNIQVEQVPDPKILNPRDAIVRITSTAICGSDLHLYNGFVPTMKRGDVLGHEFMGEIIELGRDVKNLSIGDRVVVPVPIACGGCQRGSPRCRERDPRCRSRLYRRCPCSRERRRVLEAIHEIPQQLARRRMAGIALRRSQAPPCCASLMATRP